MSNGLKNFQRVAILISGGGSTLQALLEMQHQLDICLVISNRKNAAGLLKAARFGKKTFLMTKETSFADLNRILKSCRIERVLLCGFMKILPEDFVKEWSGRIENIHPSLLPAYPGLHSAERSWAEKANMGVTIHQVNEEMDAGEIRLKQVSLSEPDHFSLAEAELLLRRTEQNLLRETAMRFF